MMIARIGMIHCRVLGGHLQGRLTQIWEFKGDSPEDVLVGLIHKDEYKLFRSLGGWVVLSWCLHSIRNTVKPKWVCVGVCACVCRNHSMWVGFGNWGFFPLRKNRLGLPLVCERLTHRKWIWLYSQWLQKAG